MCARWMIRGMECGREEEYRARPNVPSGEKETREWGAKVERFGAEGAARAHLQLRGKRESLELGGERV